MPDKTEAYVYSTLTAPVQYPAYVKGGGDMPTAETAVTIFGGANCPDKYMRTPAGVVTPVTAEELEILRQSPVFQLHEKNGFVRVEKKKMDPEKIAADMNTRDQSAPLVDQDFEALGQEPPKMGKPEDDSGNKPKASGRRA